MLVIDANVALFACGRDDGFEEIPDDQLAAPPLMWAEVRSTLHEAKWRREISAAAALSMLARLERAPVRARTHPRLGRTAWRLADDLGWAKTYDAEYLALATLLECRFVTLDARLRRGADRLGFVVSPDEL